jgi:probable DNA metabolism protein
MRQPQNLNSSPFFKMLPVTVMHQKTAILYDGSFEGFLSAVFDIYQLKLDPFSITKDTQALLFGNQMVVEKDVAKCERVFNGICAYAGIATCDMLYHSFLSCAPNIEMDIFRYLQMLFRLKRDVSGMMGESSILKVRQMQRKVTREAHRMLMFIRFEQAKDGTYFAPIAPQYDVLKIIVSHFKDRFNDQCWVIYDTHRDYGVHFNGQDVALITIDNPSFNLENGRLPESMVSESELEYQHLWQVFFKQIAIKERKNVKLQQNFMPKRFWKYLTEKRR